MLRVGIRWSIRSTESTESMDLVYGYGILVGATDHAGIGRAYVMELRMILFNTSMLYSAALCPPSLFSAVKPSAPPSPILELYPAFSAPSHSLPNPLLRRSFSGSLLCRSRRPAIYTHFSISFPESFLTPIIAMKQ